MKSEEYFDALNENELKAELDEALKMAAELDKQAYAIAKTQAEALTYLLEVAEGNSVMEIRIGDITMSLDIWHVDVLNEIYCMLANLTDLGTPE